MPTYEIVSYENTVYELLELREIFAGDDHITHASIRAENIGEIFPLVGHVVSGSLESDGEVAYVSFGEILGMIVCPKAPSGKGKRWVDVGGISLRTEQVGLDNFEHAPLLCTGARKFILKGPTLTPAGFLARFRRCCLGTRNHGVRECRQG